MKAGGGPAGPMGETKFVRVTHEGEAHLVALYMGLNPAEVSGLLQAAFKLPPRQHVVGLIDRADSSGSSSPEQERGAVVPLSLACRAPQVLGDRSFSLLLSDKEVVWERPKASKTRPTQAQESLRGLDGGIFSRGKEQAAPGAGLPAQVIRKPAGKTLWGDDDDNEEEEEEEGGADDKERIVAFIRRMAFNGLLTKDDQNALESSAIAGDVVINAAFAVALHSQDLDYLSALFKDIASNRRDSPQGMRLLEAKREMLDMAEVLQQADEVDDDQLLYLQNLILVSNEAVTDAFGVYEEDQDPVRLAESLKQLCGAEASSHTRVPAAAGASTNADNDDDGNVLHTEAERSAMKATVLEVVINLTKNGLLSARETNMANDMVLRETPVLVTAFKLFQEDENAAELHDTVARAARFAANRVTGASPSTRKNLSDAGAFASPASRLTLATKPNVAVVTSAGGGGGGAAKSRAGGAGGAVGDEGVQGRGHETTSAATGGASSGVTEERGGVSEEDDEEEVGGAATLDGFQKLVTVAVQKGMMGMSDARVICSAFEGGLVGESGRLQDLVHAAWGVYSTGGAEDDALDSLVRIVRLAVKPFQPTKAAPVNPRPFLPPSGTGAARVARGRGSTASTADLHESMSAAVNAIATQSAHILLQNNKVSAKEAACLASPSPRGCQSILKALEVFEGGSNRDVLLDAFAAIAKAEFAEAQMADRHLRHQGGEANREQEEDEDEEDDEDEDDEEQPDGQDGAGGAKGTKEGSSFDRATVELMELADCMAGDQRIGVEEALRLTELIQNKHPGVMLAYKNYAATQDVSTLVASLTAIVRMQRADGSPPAMAATKDIPDKDGDETEDPNAGDKQHGRERVVLLMHETKVLSASDATRLLLLLAREDSATLSAFEVFDSSKDVSSLVETIKIILQEAPPIAPADLSMAMHQDGGKSGSSPLLRQILQPLPETADSTATTDGTETGTSIIDPDAARTSAGEDAGRGDGGSGTGSPNDDKVAETVVSIVEGMGLDESEAAALRLAIARGDANIRGALELFRLDPDAMELKDTIARVARLVLEREREAGLAEQRVGKASAGATGNASENGSSAIAAVDAAAAAPTVEDGARSIDFTLDGKAGLFQELLQQLGAVGVMSEAQAEVIMDRYRNKDAVVFAALDVYKNESDMSELVDTLKRLT